MESKLPKNGFWGHPPGPTLQKKICANTCKKCTWKYYKFSENLDSCTHPTICSGQKLLWNLAKENATQPWKNAQKKQSQLQSNSLRSSTGSTHFWRRDIEEFPLGKYVKHILSDFGNILIHMYPNRGNGSKCGIFPTQKKIANNSK